MFVNINTEVEIAKKYNLLTITSLYVMIYNESYKIKQSAYHIHKKTHNQLLQSCKLVHIIRHDLKQQDNYILLSNRESEICASFFVFINYIYNNRNLKIEQEVWQREKTHHQILRRNNDNCVQANRVRYRRLACTRSVYLSRSTKGRKVLAGI